MKIHDSLSEAEVEVEADETPTPAEPRFPGMNALKDGYESKVVGVAEDADAILGRAREWYDPLKPQNSFHAWLVDQIAVTTLRIERCGRIERRLRDRSALRARTLWESDRTSAALALGAQIRTDPAEVVDALRETPQGCDWLSHRWALLAHSADVHSGWTPDQTRLAFDMLGTPEEFRSGQPGAPEGPAEFARRQLRELRERRLEVVPADTLDRSLAGADLSEEASPELKRLRRHEAALHRRLLWFTDQLRYVSPHHRPHPGLREHFGIEVASASTHTPSTSPALTVAPKKPLEFWEVRPPHPEVDAETPTEPIPSTPRRRARTEARLQTAEARREARKRKLERRRA